MIAGTLFAVGLTLAGIPKWAGLHVGVLGLGLNLTIVVIGSLAARSPGSEAQVSPS